MANRSVWITLIKNIVESLKPRKFQGEIAGKDHLGNTYYQIHQSDRQKKQRWFDPKDKDNFEQEIPAEWESWLRYRRKVPPTTEEVLANAAIAEKKKINAAQLAANRKTLPPPPTGSAHSFPIYDEYEVKPGTDKKTS